MLETIVKIPQKLQELNESLKALSGKPGFKQAQSVVNSVISLLSIDAPNVWKPFNDSQGKIRSNAGWLMVAEGFADKRAAYKIAGSNAESIDLKCYWMKKLNKSVISWLVALTPNFEDEPFYGNLNIGIDFIIPEKADRVFVVLSKNYIIRTVELQDALSVTQQEIFDAWQTEFDFSNKAQTHEILWKSFDLEPVNKSFYKGISAFFVELKQYLSEDTKVFDEKHAAYFTNRLIGRIVFCWFLDKKGIINPEIKYFDTGSFVSTEYYRKKLETLFFKVFNAPLGERIFKTDQKTPFLNGGLFEQRESDKFEDESLAFPNDYFDRLYAFLRHYNFTTDESTSTFQQVAIDPEMLGRIFENLLAEQVEETGEQARKAKGAFYTPREIVDYMCRESLREYLKTKIPEDELRDRRIGLLLDVKPHEFRDQQRNYRGDLKPYKYEILKALDEIKIIDPACGSGAFPMGMLHLLLDVYERLDATFDSYKKKTEIIKNNLFGVDIEPMAVEICRLRAWLSIIVDEESNSKKIQPLPNLDFKFICANSLIPLKGNNEKELFDTINKDELIEIRDKYFNARTLKSKENLRKRFEQKIGHKKTGSLYSSDREKQLKTYHPFDSENTAQFFDAEFMFGVKDGFDVVIANPPYVQIKQIPWNDRKVYEDIFRSAVGRFNLFYFFLEQSSKLVKQGCFSAFIVPDRLLLNTQCHGLREWLLSEQKILEIDAFNDSVFESAVVDSIIIFFQNTMSNYKKVNVKNKVDIACLQSMTSKKVPITYFQESPNCQFDLNYDPAVSLILNKIRSKSMQLGDIAEVKDGIIQSRITDELFLNAPIDQDSKKLLFGKDVVRYKITFNDNWVNYKPKEMLAIEMTRVKGAPGLRLRKQDIFERNKILTRQTADEIIAAYDDNRFYYSNTIHGTTITDKGYEPLYVLAVLNSRLITWYYRKTTAERGKVFAQIKIELLKQLPIKKANLKNQNQIVKLVEKILEEKEKNRETSKAKLEKQIDELIFDLYELTSEERRMFMDSC